ncbi:MAG: class II aldolase/adducin family protein [Treponema sp.]|jgi:rhamnose utilization protein RhaD (predicted bifunctional aldolase and dehydrogenase)|nr:class II aldolase/adducin family protein [Treponema sp.]
MSLEELAEISRFYGSDPEYVIAGGGNTSFKDENYLYIKASGTSLAGLRSGDFVKMDREKLRRIWDKEYPRESESREAAVLTDMMAARAPGEEGKRPSVETLLHGILPFAYVVHLHPALVNGLTCSRGGETAAAELFGGRSLWIPSVNPGYVLSRIVKDAMDDYSAKKGKPPAIIFLQNHGVFVAADSTEGIKALYAHIMDTIAGAVKRKPDVSGLVNRFGASEAWSSALRAQAGKSRKGPWFTWFVRNPEIAGFIKDEKSFYPLSSALTPDHIVYAGSDPLFVKEGAPLEEAWKNHLEKTGLIPKTVAFQGLGVFGLGASEKAAQTATELFIDALKVAVYSESFGGPLFMSGEQIRFINNWEVESYRSKVAS